MWLTFDNVIMNTSNYFIQQREISSIKLFAMIFPNNPLVALDWCLLILFCKGRHLVDWYFALAFLICSDNVDEKWKFLWRRPYSVFRSEIYWYESVKTYFKGVCQLVWFTVSNKTCVIFYFYLKIRCVTCILLYRFNNMLYVVQFCNCICRPLMNSSSATQHQFSQPPYL